VGRYGSVAWYEAWRCVACCCCSVPTCAAECNCGQMKIEERMDYRLRGVGWGWLSIVISFILVWQSPGQKRVLVVHFEPEKCIQWEAVFYSGDILNMTDAQHSTIVATGTAVTAYHLQTEWMVPAQIKPCECWCGCDIYYLDVIVCVDRSCRFALTWLMYWCHCKLAVAVALTYHSFPLWSDGEHLTCWIWNLSLFALLVCRNGKMQ